MVACMAPQVQNLLQRLLKCLISKALGKRRYGQYSFNLSFDIPSSLLTPMLSCMATPQARPATVHWANRHSLPLPLPSKPNHYIALDFQLRLAAQDVTMSVRHKSLKRHMSSSSCQSVFLGYTFRVHFYDTLLPYTFRVHF